MSSFEETLARMKSLYTYGKELNEGKDYSSHTLEYHAIAADGKSYGIIKECNKYYIKSAPKDKEMVAEAYDYLGGFCNKANYEYKSYANALKNFELKMASINEAYDGNINISTLDPFRKEDFIVEGTDQMRREIARQRQIMYNASMIMNEATDISASRKSDGTVMYDGENPESNKGENGADFGGKGSKQGKADPTYAGSHKQGVDKKVGPFDQNPTTKMNEGTAYCSKCGKNPCECSANCNEEAGDIGDNPLMPNTENWGTEGIGKGRDPKQVGWEMDGQKTVNEEENDWASKGLPSSPGVGEADSSHNNDPFNKSINEGDEDGDSENPESDSKPSHSEDDGGYGDGGEEPSTDTDFDDGLGDTGSDDEFTGDEGGESGDDETFDLNGDDFEDDGSNEFGDEFSDEGGEGGEEDLRAEIESLRAELESLKAQISGENEGDMSAMGDEPMGDEPMGNEPMGDEPMGDEPMGDEPMGDASDTFGDEIGGEPTDEFGGEEPTDEFGGGDFGEEPKENSPMMESKRRMMNKIIESVTKSIINEDELHVFGKHPGYRKQPMELPTTGEDQNKWGRDWNDDSVHSEEPFGSKIGNGDPFKELVNAITKDIMYQLKKGIPIEGGDKKKED